MRSLELQRFRANLNQSIVPNIGLKDGGCDKIVNPLWENIFNAWEVLKKRKVDLHRKILILFLVTLSGHGRYSG